MDIPQARVGTKQLHSSVDLVSRRRVVMLIDGSVLEGNQ